MTELENKNKKENKEEHEDNFRKIKGYRDLSGAEKDLINKVKDLGEEVGKTIAELEHATNNGNLSVDKRWLSIAKTDLQKGFMSLVRSIARPTTF